MKISFSVALILLGPITSAVSNAAVADPRFLRSAYDLEDPSGYCLDIPGFGPRMRKDAPITTHTCKYSRPGFSVDEEFELTATHQLRLPEYDLCLSAETLSEDSDVYTIRCSGADAHAWAVHEDGRVTPKDSPNLCLTLSDEKVFVNTAVANLTPNSSRDVSLQTCANRNKYHQRWRWAETDEKKTPSANALRSGMDASIAEGIKALGFNVSPEETAALYASESRKFSAPDVMISKEFAYGSKKGQRLQVYSGLNRNNPRDAAPIIVLVHGGGFRRGDLDSLAIVATQFAGLGYVAVNMTYPLAPEATWPSGSQSVATAIHWVRKNAKRFKGDPDSIFLFGHSAGGVNVADFVFRPSLVDGVSPSIAGAILASPVLSLEPIGSEPIESPYYGEVAEVWQEKQVVGNIERSSIPVLILTAEYDPKLFHVGAAKMINELAVKEEVIVRSRQLRGHNHTSYPVSIGTTDTRALGRSPGFHDNGQRQRKPNSVSATIYDAPYVAI